MGETIHWAKLELFQRDAIIAEKIFGWQWVAYRFYDAAPPDDQLWLLPSGEDVANLTPGEWMHYEVDEKGRGIGNRYLDVNIPNFSCVLNHAWHVIREMNKPDADGKHDLYARFIDEMVKIVGSDLFFDLFYCDPDDESQDHLTPERICIAALRARGYKVIV